MLQGASRSNELRAPVPVAVSECPDRHTRLTTRLRRLLRPGRMDGEKKQAEPAQDDRGREKGSDALFDIQ